MENSDTSHGMIRIEVRSKHGDSHLGHGFDDGPEEARGLRHCIDSAALRSVALDELERQGYGVYRELSESRAETIENIETTEPGGTDFENADEGARR
ncbi:hypothetical protein Misp01_68000 [Microtetraspora sp. NBRC 13810]|nr:hypothetical protein Misp01_68000 [Microtetraspora sp. NBRC 13810]